MSDISIAIVTYNNENVIEKALDSIIKNIDTQCDYKIFIIDNGSSDQTLNICKKFGNRISIIETKQNKGFGAGHNTLLSLINSKYHAVVNPDIMIDHNVFSGLQSFMDQHPEIGMVTPRILFPNGEVQYLNKHNPTVADLAIRVLLPNCFIDRQDRYIMKDHGYDSAYILEYATGCFMFFRTEVFKKLVGFDEKFFMYLEDADITRRTNEISQAWYYPEEYVYHDWQRGSHKNIKLFMVNIQSAFYYFKKWGLRLF